MYLALAKSVSLIVATTVMASVGGGDTQIDSETKAELEGYDDLAQTRTSTILIPTTHPQEERDINSTET